MTCKDCVYHNLCQANECLRVVTDVIDDFIDTIYLDNVQKCCAFFKNKADFVEVVRCKDCKYYSVSHLACRYPHHNGIIGIDGYCSYGERRCSDEKL